MQKLAFPTAPIRILIPDGSSLSAREAIAALGPLGYSLAVCDPNPRCVCRFSRYTRKFYRSPKMSSDPNAYLAFILELLKREHFDVLLPVHENAFLFSRAYTQISRNTHCAVADFSAFERIQSKAAFTRMLAELNLPQPPTRLITQREEIAAQHAFPFYVKTAFGTAGFGTWRITNKEEQLAVAQTLEESGAFRQRAPILVQEAAPGILEVVQALFDRGRLVAAHCYRQTAVGVGGSAAARIGVERPPVIQHLIKIGQVLNWHGSLMLDYLFYGPTSQIAYIDPNPRMGETMNATFHGINLADLIVRLSLGEVIPAQIEKRTPVESHILITMLLGKAAQKGTRRAVLIELLIALFRFGRYRHSREDFANVWLDFPSLIPVLMVAAQLILHPGDSGKIATGAVQNYALTQSAVDQIRNAPVG